MDTISNKRVFTPGLFFFAEHARHYADDSSQLEDKENRSSDPPSHNKHASYCFSLAIVYNFVEGGYALKKYNYLPGHSARFGLPGGCYFVGYLSIWLFKKSNDINVSARGYPDIYLKMSNRTSGGSNNTRIA